MMDGALPAGDAVTMDWALPAGDAATAARSYRWWDSVLHELVDRACELPEAEQAQLAALGSPLAGLVAERARERASRDRQAYLSKHRRPEGEEQA